MGYYVVDCDQMNGLNTFKVWTEWIKSRRESDSDRIWLAPVSVFNKLAERFFLYLLPPLIDCIRSTESTPCLYRSSPTWFSSHSNARARASQDRPMCYALSWAALIFNCPFRHMAIWHRCVCDHRLQCLIYPSMPIGNNKRPVAVLYSVGHRSGRFYAISIFHL